MGFDGQDCTCAARSAYECACGADWTPQELIDARARIDTLTAALRVAKEALTLVDEYKWPIHTKAREAIATINEALENGK